MSMPGEEKSPRVLNRYRDAIPAGAVNIMRPGPWGNPFVIGKHGDRGTVIARYREWLLANPAKIEAARRELAGKDLVCCCAPQACHGEVLLEVANGLEPAQRRARVGEGAVPR